MFFVTLISIIVALLIGLGIKWFLANSDDYRSITWTEYALTTAAIVVIVAPLSSWAGVKLAVQSRTTFYEFWNGWEQSATVQEITCSRDGPCYWEYSCDPYIVCHTVCTSDGKTESCHEECHTEYHDCPYCTSEYNYDVNTTLGPYRIASNRFPFNPDSHRWRRGEEVTQDVINRAGVGPPQFWLNAKARIDSGLPGPVTKQSSYTNWLLRSDYSILRNYSDKIADFQKRNLLPPFVTDIHDFYWADKITFVGVGVSNPKVWQRRVEYINAELGRSLQGDLHIVVVKGVSDPDGYILSLKAAWQNAEVYKRNTASKNTILVAIGTDGKTVEWARAITGMPLGNELLITRLRNEFKGMPLDVDSVVGQTHAHLSNGRIDSVSVLGGLANYLLKQNPFQRVHMRDYAYLKKEIKPSTAGYVWTTVLSIIVCSLAWIPAILLGDSWKSRYGY